MSANTSIEWNRSLFLQISDRFGVTPEIPENGFDAIPTDPHGLLFWLFVRQARPLFDDAGAHVGWDEASDDKREKLLIIAQEVARANGFELDLGGAA